MDRGVEAPRENPIKEITARMDPRDILANATKQGIDRDFDNVLVVETESWRETTE